MLTNTQKKREKRSSTFDKHLCEALVLANDTLICSIISQGRLIDCKCSEIPVGLHDIPEKVTDALKVNRALKYQFIKMLIWFSANVQKIIIDKNTFLFNLD